MLVKCNVSIFILTLTIIVDASVINGGIGRTFLSTHKSVARRAFVHVRGICLKGT